MLRRARQDSLRIDHALPGRPIFDWSVQVSKIFVTGHSMGGSLAMMFACIIKGWSERISALPEGKSLAIVGRRRTPPSRSASLGPREVIGDGEEGDRGEIDP